MMGKQTKKPNAIKAFQQVKDEENGLQEFYLRYLENIAYAYPADLIKFACYAPIVKV